jgi:cell volume regulation protein A
LFNWLQPQDRGHYYVLFVGIVLLTYGLAEVSQAVRSALLGSSA